MTSDPVTAFERDRPRAFLVGYSSFEPFTLDSVAFCEIDTDSLAVTATYLYTKPRSSGQAVALAEAPHPPAALASQVAVSGLDVGPQTPFAASRVPPRRYYVRVRAGNYAELGAPSNEVVVRVP